MASTATGSGRPGGRLPDAVGCASLKLRYAQARSGSDRCERDDDCSIEPRGRFYTGLDGCFRVKSRMFEGAVADRLGEEWLDAGCAGAFESCPTARPSAMCRAGVCRERPPPPIPEDWARVDVEETLSLFLPPDLVEVSFVRSCGNGPAVRRFHGAGLEVRVEYGYELGYLPLSADDVKEPLPPRVVARAQRQIGAHEATLLDFRTPDLSSKATAPDGSWPRYHFVRALSVQNLEAPFGARSRGLGMGTGPVALAVTIEGERAHEPVSSRILETLSFW